MAPPLPTLIRNEFLRQLLADQHADGVRTVDYYQALFPGYEGGIAEQYARRCATTRLRESPGRRHELRGE